MSSLATGLRPVTPLWVERYLQETRPRLCLDTRTQALFLTGYGGPFNPDVLSRMVTEWVAKAGLPKKGSCHLLRHTCATHMLEGGADIRYCKRARGGGRMDRGGGRFPHKP